MQLGLRLSPSGANVRVLSVRALSAPHLEAMPLYLALLSIRPTAFNGLYREHLGAVIVGPGWEGFPEKYAVDRRDRPVVQQSRVRAGGVGSLEYGLQGST